MPQHRLVFRESVPAPVDKVFAFFADHDGFASLFGGSCKRIQEGRGEPDGLGSIRRIGRSPFSFDETIVTFARLRRIEYRITRGSPVRNHLGTIDFTTLGGSTVVHYVIRFDSRIPGCGGLFAWMLRRAWNRNAAAALARLAD